MNFTEKNQLLDKAEALNKTLENSYLALALILVEVEETEAFKEAGYEDFAGYYKEALGREKSTVSRLLGVGRWLRDNQVGLPAGQLSYRRLHASIRAYPDKDPGFVLAAAENNTFDDLREQDIENKFGLHDHKMGEERWGRCDKCGKFCRV